MRDRVLKVVLVIVGTLFVLAVVPGVLFFIRQPSVPMLMSLYVAMGIFLLLAVRDPARHRSLIAYAGWANVAHASVMALQEYWHLLEPKEITGVILFAIIGVTLVALTPAKQPAARAAASV